jgi:hypothetical protein
MSIHNTYVFGDISCDHPTCQEMVEDVKVFLAEHNRSIGEYDSVDVLATDGGVELPEGWTSKPWAGHLCPEHSPKEKTE